jgi:hypothetical protein
MPPRRFELRTTLARTEHGSIPKREGQLSGGGIELEFLHHAVAFLLHTDSERFYGNIDREAAAFDVPRTGDGAPT